MKRVIALMLALLMCMTFAAQSAQALAEATGENWDHAMHFIVRHWHAEKVQDAPFQGNADTGTSDRAFVVIEGYIVPENGHYNFYMVYQGNDDKGHQKGDRELLPSGYTSAYVQSINQSNGEIVLSASPIENVEELSAFSVSAGHNAVTYGAYGISILYDQYVHLVKAHAFYLKHATEVYGTDDTTVFGHNGMTSGSDEIDTAYVYVYTQVPKNGANKIGDVVKVNGEPVTKEVDNKSKLGLNPGEDAEFVKVYSTTEGLHTDKTAYGTDDKRTFDVELEVWNTYGKAPQVGMVLDASGSMAFAAEDLEAINVYDALGIKKSGDEFVNGDPITNETLRSLIDKIGKKPIGEDWSGVFLSDEEVALLLNKNYTDNSKLGVSGYSYFVFDSRKDVQEYTPLAYWSGAGTMIPVTSLTGFYQFIKAVEGDTTGKLRAWLVNDADTTQNAVMLEQPTGTETVFKEYTVSDWGAETRANMSEKTGFNLNPPKDRVNELALQLGAQPTGRNFTVSFKVTQEAGTKPTAAAEILYIGDLDQANGYVRFYREGSGNSTNRMKSEAGGINLNNVFNDAGATHTVTLVFQGSANGTTSVTAYVDGNQNQSGTNTYTGTVSLPENKYIIFNGLKDAYDGGNIFIDDILFFDVALNKEQVKALYGFNTSTGPEGLKQIGGVLPDFAMTEAGDILGALNWQNGNKNGRSFTEAGWYYMTHAGQWTNHYNNPNLNTAKRLCGIIGSTSNGYSDSNVGEYKADSDSAIRFYIREDGKLCCFFNAGDGSSAAHFEYSCVYQLEDEDYVKVESLQRAIGAFVTGLSEISPFSTVSAVRFSTNNIQEADFDKLVLLDWTSDASESAKILSLQRGQGNAQDSEISATNGIAQYNYGLTGSTSTWRGLQSFYDNLLINDNDNAEKYLIIFTDGLDTDRDSNDAQKAIDLAKKIKDEEGYTIFTVMLNGGPVTQGTDNYAKAENFLITLSGKKDGQEDEQFFFSTETAGNQDSSMKKEDILTEIFSEKILKQITKPLTGYTVKDYIDPRFNLVDAEGNEWLLGQNGDVTITSPKADDTDGSDGEEGDQDAAEGAEVRLTAEGVVFPLGQNSDEDARKPYLHYDSQQELYYLEWVDQEIPTSGLGVSALAVWNATLTVRAKEDFIGGNAVLTNGHTKQMNMVYHPDDLIGAGQHGASSGIDDMIQDDDNPLPSKGFPRTVVNVEMPAPARTSDQIVYLGESKDIVSIIREMISNAIVDENNEIGSRWYWQYLERFEHAEHGNKNVVDDLVAAGSKGIDIPYYYLDSALSDYPNHTGTVAHQNDSMGIIHYEWTLIDPKTGEEIAVSDLAPVSDISDKELRLSVTYVPFAVGDADDTDEAEEVGSSRAEILKELTKSDTNYQWDKVYKKAVGKIKDEQTGDYVQTIKVVSGQIAMRLKVRKDDVATLKRNGIEEITYVAQLNRAYTPSNSGGEDGDDEQDDGESGVAEDVGMEGEEGTESGGSTAGGSGSDIVGTYRITVKLEDLDPSKTGGYYEEDETYYYIYVPRYDAEHPENEAMISFAGGYPKAEVQGLPIGDYTLTMLTGDGNSSEEKLFKFSSIKSVTPLENAYKSHFTRYPGQLGEKDEKTTQPIALNEFAAPYAGDNAPRLGAGTSKTYTDERYALLEVAVELETGKVTIIKKVESEYPDDQNLEFEFVVELSSANGEPLNGSFQYTIDGVESDTPIGNMGTIRLKHGQSATIEGLPVGTIVKVTEAAEGFEQHWTITGGEEVKGETTDGDEEPDGDGDEDAEAAEEEGDDQEVEDNEDTAPSEGEQENAVASNERQITIASPDITYDVINERKPVDLTLSKQVTGEKGDKEKSWTFTVTLTVPEGVELAERYACVGAVLEGTEDVEKPEIDYVSPKAQGDGTYRFTLNLTHGQQVTIKDLPYGIGYKVAEDEAGAHGYGTTVTGEALENAVYGAGAASGELSADPNIRFVNRNPAGSVTIRKTVKSLDPSDLNSDDLTFTFQVSLRRDGQDVKGTYTIVPGAGSDEEADSEIVADMPDDEDDASGETTDPSSPEGSFTIDGSGEITLRHGQSAIFEGLPVGTLVEVAENAAEGFTTSVTLTINDEEQASAGSALVSSDEDIIVFDYVNERNPVDLKLSKTVSGKLGDKDKVWEFKVTLKNVPADDKLEEKTFSCAGGVLDGEEYKDIQKPDDRTLTPEKGDAEGEYILKVSLAHGQTMTIHGLPYGVQYEVTETEANTAGYVTTVTGSDSGRLTENGSVAYNNQNPAGGVTISKVVDSLDPADLDSSSLSFTFDVALKDALGNDVSGEYTVITAGSPAASDASEDEAGGETADSETTETLKINGSGTITLGHNQSAVFVSLPEDTVVTVSERAVTGFATEAKLYVNGQEQTQTASATVKDNDSIVFSYINTREPVSLTLSKTVSGTLGDQEKAWSFTVKLTVPADYALSDHYDCVASALDGVDKPEIDRVSVGNGVISGTEKVYTFVVTLKHGQKVTIKDLPYGVQYEVIENEADADGYVTTVTGSDSGRLTESGSIAYNNQNPAGGVTIRKVVDSKDAATVEKEFTFTVKFERLEGGERIPLSDSFSYTGTGTDPASGTLANGDTVKLGHEAYISIEKLPKGTLVTVTEDEDSAFDSVISASGATAYDKNTYMVDDDNVRIAFTATNTLKLVNLTIGKMVSGKESDETQPWDFTVLLTPPEGIKLNDSYACVGGENGPAQTVFSLEDNGDGTYSGSVTLKHGQTLMILNLPYGTRYTVTELDANKDGYAATVRDQDDSNPEHGPGWIGGVLDRHRSVTFTNHNPAGVVEISKTVFGSSEQADLEKLFTFTVELYDADGQPLEKAYPYTGSSDIKGVDAPEDGEIMHGQTVELMHGQKITIADLPVNTTVKVTETADAQFTTSVTVTTTQGTEKTGVNSADVEFANENEIYSFLFSNTRKTGDLTVSKEIQANNPDVGQSFEFILTLTDADGEPLTGTYSSNLGELGNGSTFELRHGGSVTITGLPVGTKYKVEESKTGGYTPNVTNGEGVIGEGDSILVQFVNVPPSYPKVELHKYQSVNGGERTQEAQQVQAADRVTYTLVVTNSGDTVARNVIITDEVPAGLILIELSITQGGEARTEDGKTVITWELGDLEANTSVELSFTVVVPATETETIWRNIATGVYDNLPPEEPPLTSEEVEIESRKRTGDLTVTKTVVGSLADPEKSFTFTVTLSDTSINGTYGDMEFVDGVASFTLRHGESKSATGLPEGVTYTVSESDNEGYTVTAMGAAGEIVADTTQTAAFVNDAGHRKPEKTETQVNGADVAVETAPDGTVLGPDVKVGDLITYRITWVNDQPDEADVTIIDRLPQEVDFVSATVGGVYDPITHTVTWHLTGTPSGNTGWVSVTVRVNERAQDGVAIVNRASVQVGNGAEEETNSTENTPRESNGLTVTKTVTGDGGDLTEEFSFIVRLSDTSVNGVYGDMLFINGVASFKLRHGESKTARNLPAGVRYTVDELSASQNGYVTTSMNESGTIPESGIIQVNFVNAKDRADVPQTGDQSQLALWAVLALTSLLGLALCALIRRREER